MEARRITRAGAIAVSIGVNGADVRTTPAQSADAADSYAIGSCVFLAIKNDAASFTTAHIKDLLAPVTIDYNATNPAEAFQKSLPAAARPSHQETPGAGRHE